MRIKQALILTLMLTLMTFAITTTTTQAATSNVAPDQCSNPSDSIQIEAAKSELAFTQTSYTVKKNTCYKVKFKNPTDNVEHDLTIDNVNNNDFSFKKVHIPVANNTDGPNGDGIKSQNVMFPNADTELTFYCSEPGHKESGMVGTITVGNGTSSSLPLSIWPVFISLAALPVLRRKSFNK